MKKCINLDNTIEVIYKDGSSTLKTEITRLSFETLNSLVTFPIARCVNCWKMRPSILH